MGGATSEATPYKAMAADLLGFKPCFNQLEFSEASTTTMGGVATSVGGSVIGPVTTKPTSFNQLEYSEASTNVGGASTLSGGAAIWGKPTNFNQLEFSEASTTNVGGATTLEEGSRLDEKPTSFNQPESISKIGREAGDSVDGDAATKTLVGGAISILQGERGGASEERGGVNHSGDGKDPVSSGMATPDGKRMSSALGFGECPGLF